MREVKSCLNALALYCLLLAVNILPTADIIPSHFPTANLSSVYLITLSVCLVLRYYLRVAGSAPMKRMMLVLSYMIVALLALRCVKYSVFGSTSALGRYTWYLYYVPLLLIPLSLFYIALYVFRYDYRQINKRWGWVAAVTAALILSVLTNDWHKLMFRFQPGFANWDGDYSHGPLFIAVSVWQYGLFAISVATLMKKCSITRIRHRAWLILLPFSMGVVLILLLIIGMMPQINGHNPVEFPEVYCFMVAAALECCMQLGLIPSNGSYGRLMQATSLAVQITDGPGKAVYRSPVSKDLTREQFSLPDGARVGEHTVLRKMPIPGGYALWENDVTDIDTINAHLQESWEALSEESELIRLNGELKESRLRIEQRTAVYDSIANRVQNQSRAISRLAEQALATRDTALRDKYRKHIVLLGAYIKRYANLMLIASQSDTIRAEELGLDFSEVLRYLNLYGIPGELVNPAQGDFPISGVLTLFETFGNLLESCLGTLTGVCVYLSSERNYLTLKLTLENVSFDREPSFVEQLQLCGIATRYEQEDAVVYFRFTLPKGGKTE